MSEALRRLEAADGCDSSDPQVIVFAHRKSNYSIYLSERDYWVLDDRAWAMDEEQIPYDHSDRFGIPVVNHLNAGHFLRMMRPFEIPLEVLADFYGGGVRSGWESSRLLAFAPILLVDFDARCLSSMYQELSTFETYVPNGWRGRHFDFYDLVPERYRYWVVDEVDTTETRYWTREKPGYVSD